VKRLPRNCAYFELMSDYNRTVPRVDDTVKHRCRGLQAGHGLQSYEQPACLNWAAGDLSVVLLFFVLSSLSCRHRRSSTVLLSLPPLLTYVRTVYVRFVTTMTSLPLEPGRRPALRHSHSLTLFASCLTLTCPFVQHYGRCRKGVCLVTRYLPLGSIQLS
jgi:hypothetical protein